MTANRTSANAGSGQIPMSTCRPHSRTPVTNGRLNLRNRRATAPFRPDQRSYSEGRVEISDAGVAHLEQFERHHYGEQ
jgi:hypothetical protein